MHACLKTTQRKGKGKGKATAVKQESMKKAAAESKKAEESGEVQVTSKLADEIIRPTKRSKESSSSSACATDREQEGGGQDDDIEMIGTKGGSELPHNRFACPEKIFDPHDKATTREDRCKLCYCFVCDRPAGDCLEWSDHCHATTSGPSASTWKRLRARAKPLVLAGKRPPVSGLHKAPLPSPSSSASPPSTFPFGSSSSQPLPGALPPTAPPLPPPFLACLCEEFCQPVRKVIGSYHSDGLMKVIPPVKRVAYFEGLNPADAQHVEDTAVEGTLNFIADMKLYRNRNYRKSPAALREQKREKFLRESRPYFQKTPAGGGTFDVTVATRRDPTLGPPGQASPAVVRLGVLSGVGFRIRNIHPQNPDTRKVFFDRFVSCTPLPISVWAEEHPDLSEGYIDLDKPEDITLFKVLAKAHKERLIDVELEADYDSNTNRGSLTVDVILMPSLLTRTDLSERRWDHSYSRLESTEVGPVDFVRVVERLVLKTVFEKTTIEPGTSSTVAGANTNADGSSSVSASASDPRKKKTKKNKKQTKPDSPRVSSTPSSPSSAAAAAAAGVAGTSSSSASSSSSSKKKKGKARAGKRSTAAATKREGGGTAGGGSSSSALGGGGSGGGGAGLDVGEAAGAGVVVGRPGRVFTPSQEGYGGRASTDVTLRGLINSVRAEEVKERTFELRNPGELLKALENLQHGAVVKQPDCLTVELFEHQLQAAQFMYDQEMLNGGALQHLWAELPPHPQAPVNGDRSCEFRRCWFSPMLNRFTSVNPFTAGIKGGLLCDEMGLGKTAATLTLHLLNPPKTPSEGVPLDSNEWGPITGAQATAMTAPRATSGISRSPGAVVSKGTLVVCKVSLVGQWVQEAKRLCGGALTIYPYHGQSRNRNLAFLSKFDMVVTTYGVVQMDATRNKGYPPLRQIRWWRVVLDESHTIASMSQMAQAAKQLVANRRWCMTGTPCNVKFSDLNGQLGFAGVEGAFRDRDLGTRWPTRETQVEVVAFLRRFVLRHSQNMKLDNNSLLGLPAITYKVETLQLPKRELEAYRKFEKGLQKEYLVVRQRLLNWRGSHTMAVLTLLTKFRQACSGGQLLIGLSTPAEIQGDSSAHSGGVPAQDKEREEEEEEDAMDYHDDDEDDDSEEEDTRTNEGAAAAESMDALCSVCHELLDSPVKTPCGHVFCEACITAALTKGTDEGPCPKCKKTVALDDLTPIGGGCEGGGSTGGGGNGATGPGVLMETKLEALVKKLSDIHTKDPSSKSLVFSQYNSSLDWLKRTLPKKGFQFRTLTGSMSLKQRTDALQAFSNDPPTTVFLLSVRAGAVGINLTQANHVFLLEPLLNLALEKQAIGRVHRLGQTRPVTVTKLVLADSVETRILAMQERQANDGGSAGSSSKAPSGISGNLARDVAKHLKVGEYDSLFGMSDINDAAV
eukprot:g16478.t1